MRINVYSQELSKEVTVVSKKSDNGKTHWGIRIMIQSPDCLHNVPGDDDRSAITYWLPNDKSFTPMDLARVFRAAAAMAEALSHVV